MGDVVQYGYLMVCDYTDAEQHRESFDALAVQRWRDYAVPAGYRITGDPTSITLHKDRFPEGPFDGGIRVVGPAVKEEGS